MYLTRESFINQRAFFPKSQARLLEQLQKQPLQTHDHKQKGKPIWSKPINNAKL